MEFSVNVLAIIINLIKIYVSKFVKKFEIHRLNFIIADETAFFKDEKKHDKTDL